MLFSFVFAQKFYTLTHPSKYWGPALPKHRARVHHLAQFEIDPHGLAKENMEDGLSPNDIKVRINRFRYC